MPKKTNSPRSTDPRKYFYMLAKDIMEGVAVAKARGIPHARVVFVRNAEQLKGLANLTLVLCPGFHDRPDAQDIIAAARDRHCQIRKPEQVQP